MRTFDVRLARPDDEDDLVFLLQEMHEEAGFGSFSEAQARLAIEIGLRRDGGMIGIIRGRREIEASIGLFLARPMFSQDNVLMDHWSFVREPYRRSERAKCLILFGKWCATELGRPLLVSAIGNEKTQRKVELYERQLPRAGALFLYTPEVAA